MDFQEDLTPFFADFGAAGTLAGRAVRGIYRSNAGTPALGGMLMQHQEPVYLMPAADEQPDDRGATLEIPQGIFTVRRIEPLPADPSVVYLLLQAAS